MKYLRVFLLTVAVLSFAIVAAGSVIPDIHIVFDPTQTPVPLTDVLQANAPVTAPWESCTDKGIPSDLSGETACLALANLTGQPITALNFAFTVPVGSPLIGQIVDCENGPKDTFLINNNCPAGTLAGGEVVDILFNGGDPIPNQFDFFFGADAAGLNSLADFPPVTVTADPAPEPATLLFFATGLAVLGLGLGWRRKSSSALA